MEKFLNDLRIYEISSINRYVVGKENYPMINNGRRHFGFICTFSGTEHYNFCDRTISATDGSVLLIPKNEAYTISLDGELSDTVVIDFEIIGDLPSQPFIVNFGTDSHIQSRFIEALKIWKNKKVGFDTDCMSIVYKIISDMKKQSVLRLHPKNYLKIEDAVTFLKKHFCDEDFRISTLYKIADTSPKYFNTLFKTQFGMPPKEYALFLKTEKAKELLLDKKLSIGYIAEVLGFVDLYHFSKFFKKETSYSPTEYRKIMQK